MIHFPTPEEVSLRKEKFKKRSGKRKPLLERNLKIEMAIRKLGNATVFYFKKKASHDLD